MKKGLIIIIIVVIILFVVGIVTYPYIFSSNNAKNSCSVMDDSKCNKKCNIDSDCKKVECSCINKLETMNASEGSCNTFVAFDCKCENNICKSESIIPNNTGGVCGNGICEGGEGPKCPTCDTPGNCGACSTGTCPQDCNANKYSCNINSNCISQCTNGCVNKEWSKSNRDNTECVRAWDCSCVNEICYTDGKSPYTCPTQKTIDCMPAVGATYPQTLSKYCETDYRNWITQNCNVIFTD